MAFPGNTSHFRLWCLIGVEPLKNEHMGSHLSIWRRNMRKTEQQRMQFKKIFCVANPTIPNQALDEAAKNDRH